MNKINVKEKVLWNESLGAGYFKMGITANSIYATAIPGQFVMVHADQVLTPLLRRPFSIHQINKGSDGEVSSIDILYKVVGDSTQRFSEMKPGTTIHLLGPLGNGFTVPRGGGQRIFIVGGGIGIAPMVFLAQELMAKGIFPSLCRAFIGGRTKSDILCEAAFAAMGIPVTITTDNGSLGQKGFVTEAVSAAMEPDLPDLICSCGPHLMLKKVAAIASENGIPCQVSIETMMACGMGACLGCAVPANDPSGHYKHACIDGPVFDAETILLE